MPPSMPRLTPLSATSRPLIRNLACTINAQLYVAQLLRDLCLEADQMDR